MPEEENIDFVYRKSYKMRTVGTGGYEVSVPKEIVERAARKHGLDVTTFLSKFRLVHLFNNFAEIDAAYRFEPIETNAPNIPKIK